VGTRIRNTITFLGGHDVRVTLDLDLPDALQDELQMAAKTSGIAPQTWAALAIEAELASRRLPRVKPAILGARIGKAKIEEDMEPVGYTVHFS
jgi:hypothetical protein